MPYKIINKSRQGIPVIVRENGKDKYIDLSYTGEYSTCISEEVTESIKALEVLKLIKIKEI